MNEAEATDKTLTKKINKARKAVEYAQRLYDLGQKADDLDTLKLLKEELDDYLQKMRRRVRQYEHALVTWRRDGYFNL